MLIQYIWQEASTIASGLRLPKSFVDQIILYDIRESQGFAITVAPSEILDAQKKLGSQEGIFPLLRAPPPRQP